MSHLRSLGLAVVSALLLSGAAQAQISSPAYFQPAQSIQPATDLGKRPRASEDENIGKEGPAAERAAEPVTPEEQTGVIRERPGRIRPVVILPPIDPSQVSPPAPHLPRESISIPDRWRLIQTLGFKFPWYDPYNQNALKGDLPVLHKLGHELFFNLGVISDTLVELRRVPTPVAGQVSIRPGANDIYGGNKQRIFGQNLITSFSLQKGDTTFRPPDFELKFVPVLNYTNVSVAEAGALRANPALGKRRTDNYLGVQELFGDLHLRNVSDRFDFDSVRIGIQPFTNDFRGFLFQDVPFGVRVFGNRSNNEYQYNLAWFRRLEKDTNSGLNNVSKKFRDDDVFVSNLYRQDFPVKGFTSQVSVVHNRNREVKAHYDTNGILVRPALLGDLQPHRYRVTYLGYSGDGHFDRWNLSTSAYLATGTDDRNPLAQRQQSIRAGMFASELSRDFSWVRVRGNLLLSTGDKNPYDGKATGFDSILENPQFAGSDSSYFIRQGLPLIGGGGVALSARNGIQASLRSSKDEGQSNFVNPGLKLIGIGADFDLRPEVRVFTNVSHLRFAETASLAALRNQSITSDSLGIDYSVGFHWRPFFNQNMIINGSVAVLKPGDGLKALYGANQGSLYSVLLNSVLSF